MRRTLGTLVSALLLVACDGTPGARLGTYAVTATMVQNTCGTQVGDYAASATFNVVLSLDRGVLSWTPTGATSATGAYDSSTHAFRLDQTTSTQAVAPNRAYQTPGCIIDRVDSVAGTIAIAGDAGTTQLTDVDAGPLAGAFTADETIGYGSEAGSDCTPVVGVNPGQVLALPCTITYHMTATRTGP